MLMSIQVKKIVTRVWNCCKLYFLWIFIHFMVANCYAYFCTQPSFWGFIISPLLVSTPHCMALQWLLHNSVAIINHMWSLIGAWFSVNLLWNYNKDE